MSLGSRRIRFHRSQKPFKPTTLHNKGNTTIRDHLTILLSRLVILALQPSLTAPTQTRKHWELERQKKKACLTSTTAEKRKNVALHDKYSFLGGHLEIRAENKRKMELWDW